MHSLSAFDQFYEETYPALLAPLVDPACQWLYESDTDTYQTVVNATKNTLTAAAPLLVWEAYEESPGAGKDNYARFLHGSVAVLFRCDKSLVQQKDAFRQARLALYTLLERMREDEGHGPLADHAVYIVPDRMPLEKIGPVSTAWYGMGVNFSWRLPLDSLY